MKNRLSIVVALAGACAVTAAPLDRATPESQGVPSDAILRWIDACEREIKAPNGLHGFVILRHGRTIAEGTWAPYDTLNRPHMLYSHSKSFTSTAIGFLVDEGRLDLDARVLSFFPDKTPANPSPNLLALRVRDLLTMNVGASFSDAERKDIEGDWVKAFLANDIEKEPGTVFKYDSCATHMLAAIAERVSGMKLMDFLKARLFDPLGMKSPWSTVSPTGIACGGWGMNMTTRDLARFGQLYLDHGMWNGQRLLSREWVVAATSRQTWSGAIGVTGEDGSDWHQGYGFQFWRCRHNAFRADGASGQYTIVMPDQDAVISINAGLRDMQQEINLVWEHLLPAFGPKPLPEDPAPQQALAARCAALALPVQKGSAEPSPLPLKDARVSKNPFNLTNAALEKTKQGWALVRPDGVRFAIGDGSWAVTPYTFSKSNVEALFALIGTRDVAMSGAWTAPGVFTVRWYLLGATQHGSFTVAARRATKMVAHAGAGDLTMPPASKPAYSNAVATACDIVKLDLQYTKDKQIVMGHDPDLKRVMGWNTNITAVTYAEILDKGRFLEHGKPGNERIVRLDEALAIVKTAPEFWLDFKHFNPEMAEKVLCEVAKAGIGLERLMVATFTKPALQYFRDHHPEIRRVGHIGVTALTNGTWKCYAAPKKTFKDRREVMDAVLRYRDEMGLFGVNMPVISSQTRPEDVTYLQQNGLWVSLWFVQNEQKAWKYRTAHADAFVTDHVSKARHPRKE